MHVSSELIKYSIGLTNKSVVLAGPERAGVCGKKLKLVRTMYGGVAKN